MLASRVSYGLFRMSLALGLSATPLMFPCRGTAETASSPPKAARIVDGIIAKVNGEPVFLRGMKADYWLAQGGGAKTRIRDRMDRVLDRKLLAQEAERLKMGAGDAEELAREVQKKVRDLGARTGGGKGGVSREEIERWVREDLAIRVLKEKRIGLLVVVSDSDVETYYAEHAGEFGGAALTGVRHKVVDRIYRKKFDEQYDRWFTSLKRRSQFEVFLDEDPWKTFDFEAYFQSGP
ncbi:MAG: hypothetical protein HYT87_09835 [Nitrospirae bacterium]|nr:hypothetical protein [Nitrospirota bacterium]